MFEDDNKLEQVDFVINFVSDWHVTLPPSESLMEIRHDADFLN